jgi:hypothetical protein
MLPYIKYILLSIYYVLVGTVLPFDHILQHLIQKFIEKKQAALKLLKMAKKTTTNNIEIFN